MLAAHAAVAIENARLLRAQPRAQHRRGAQPARARAARRGQPEAVRARAHRRGGRDAARARPGRRRPSRSRGSRELAQEALAELRALIFELRPAVARGGGAGGDAAQARRHARRVHGRDVELRITRRGADRARRPSGEVLRIAQEALNNALRHADAERIELRLQGRDGRLDADASPTTASASTRDAPGLRSRRLGLTSMEERARALGGTLAVGLAARRRHDGDARGAAMIRVLIADDHAVVRQGLRTFLDLQDDIEVVGEAARRRRGAGGGRAARARRRADRPRDAAAWTGSRRSGGCASSVPGRARDRALELRRRRQGVPGRARGRGRLPAQGRPAAGAGGGDPHGRTAAARCCTRRSRRGCWQDADRGPADAARARGARR